MDIESKAILIVTNNYRPYSGGVVSSIDAFARGLRGLGHSVSIVTLDFTGQESDDPGVYRIFCPIKFQYKKNRMAIPWRATNELRRLIKQLKPDVVHSQHPFLLGISAMIVCKQLGVPLVFTHHTQYAQYSHYIPLPGLVVKPVINRCVQWYAQRVDAIIAPSRAVKQELDKKVDKSSQVLPSPISPVFFGSIVDRQAGKPFKLLTVSRFMSEKNIEFLLDTFARLPQKDYSLTLVGYGAQLAYLKQHAYITLGLSRNKVQFIVKPPKKKLIELYRSSDIFLFASQTETQGLVLAEAMASGLPVIALKSSALEDIVDGSNGRLVSTQKHMLEYIEALTKDKELYSKVRASAYKTAQRYSVDSLSRRLVAFYDQVII
ncbi:MAG TPA: glycosyltransferase [Candidatus Babeliales bacterium]|nr:glycosyltransferase [Candidatus Babeliales bacterium]